MVNSNDFINAIERDIIFVKGDTLSFNFQIQGLRHEMPDNLTFTCKNHYDDTDALFTCEIGNGISLENYDEEKDLSTFTLRVAPHKTEELDLSRYYYDLQMNAGNDVITLLRGRLILVYSVSD